MKSFDWRRIRVLGIAGLIVLVPVSFIVAWAVAPIWNSIVQAEYDTELVHHYEMLAAEKPAYQAELAKAVANLANSGVLYNGSSTELASAQLQNTVQGLVAQAGGQVQSSAIGTPQTAHDMQILTVSLSLSLPPAQLAGFLSSLDAQKPYLVVQGIDLRSTDYGNQTGPLSVQLQVNGFSDIQ